MSLVCASMCGLSFGDTHARLAGEVEWKGEPSYVPFITAECVWSVRLAYLTPGGHFETWTDRRVRMQGTHVCTATGRIRFTCGANGLVAETSRIGSMHPNSERLSRLTSRLPFD